MKSCHKLGFICGLFCCLLSACQSSPAIATTLTPARPSYTLMQSNSPTATITPGVALSPTPILTLTVDWDAYQHPTLTPAEQATLESPPPQVYYFAGNRLYRVTVNQTPAAVEAFQSIDTVRDAVWVGGQMAILGADGVLLFDPQTDQTETLVQFKTAIRQGQLFYAAAARQLVYRGEISDSQADFGISNLLGIYDFAQKTSRDISFAYSAMTSYSILGYDGQQGRLYLQPLGQDPSFGKIWIYAINSGQLITRPETRSDEAIPLLSPDLNLLAGTLFDDSTSTGYIELYDLPHPSVTPLAFALPDPPSQIAAYAFSSDGRELYFLLKEGRIFSDSTRADGIWSMDLADGKLRQLNATAENWQTWARLDDQWVALFQAIDGKTELVNLESGVGVSYALPADAGVIVHR